MYFPFVTDDSFGKSGWREILAQVKVPKTQEYFVYFKFFKLHSWAKRSASRRRRMDQRLHLGDCTVGAKDPPSARRRFIQRFPS